MADIEETYIETSAANTYNEDTTPLPKSSSGNNSGTFLWN